MAEPDPVEMEVVNVSKYALVVLVDSDGRVRVTSGMGYPKRVQADILRIIAGIIADSADRQAGEEGEPPRG